MVNTVESLSQEDLLEDEEEIKGYTSSIFKCSLFLTTKLIVLAGSRYVVYELENYHEQSFMFSHWFLLGLIIFYLTILFFYGKVHGSLSPRLLPVMNVILFLTEFLMMMNTNYNPIATITMGFLAVYFFLIGILTRSRGYYSLRMSFGILFVFAVFNIITFFLYALDYFH